MIDLKSLKIKERLANPGNYGGKRDKSQIKYLILHYTANDGDHDEGNATYYKNNVVKASAHYFVDDDSITRSVPDDRVAWAVGGKKWADCNKTGGGSMYGKITNTNSLSVEMCDTKKDGTLMATNATLDRTVDLCKALMHDYNITIDRVYRHFDVTGKYCPAYFMDVNKWEQFKNRLVEQPKKEDDDDMDVKRFTELFREMRKELQDNDSSAYSEKARQWAVETGLIEGGGKSYMWEDMLTREQLVTVLYRFAKLFGLV